MRAFCTGRLARRIFRGALLVALTLGAFAITRDVRAEDPPSAWDRVKDPDRKTTADSLDEDIALGARERYRRHVDANRQLFPPPNRSPVLDPRRGLHVARLILENAHAETSKDPTLRFDYGIVLERMEENIHAARVLSRVLAEAPNHPAAEQGWLSLAYAYARLDRPNEEIAAYEKYLTFAVDPEDRSQALLNMAEGEMRRGQLPAAIRGYENAIADSQNLRTSRGLFTYILSIWGLAVALDRNGDASGAVREAKRAASHDRELAIVGDPVNVFFVPSYERFFYLGLGELALADLAASNRDKAEHYDKAARRFGYYLAESSSDDRWRARAKAHLMFAESKLKTNHAPIATDADTEL